MQCLGPFIAIDTTAVILQRYFLAIRSVSFTLDPFSLSSLSSIRLADGRKYLARFAPPRESQSVCLDRDP